MELSLPQQGRTPGDSSLGGPSTEVGVAGGSAGVAKVHDVECPEPLSDGACCEEVGWGGEGAAETTPMPSGEGAGPASRRCM